MNHFFLFFYFLLTDAYVAVLLDSNPKTLLWATTNAAQTWNLEFTADSHLYDVCERFSMFSEPIQKNRCFFLHTIAVQQLVPLGHLFHTGFVV